MSNSRALLLVAAFTAAAHGQVFDRSIVLPPAEVERLDATSSAHLENAKRFLAERQWAEAVEAIRRVQEAEPSRLVQVEMSRAATGFERYVTAGEYCQWRLAALANEAPEALERGSQARRNGEAFRVRSPYIGTAFGSCANRCSGGASAQAAMA